ncbi:MAG: alpha/beta hydrolase [Chloroflexota bacterium]|nr:alpha/beta hydrolase [Chloroflexota bacterium]
MTSGPGARYAVEVFDEPYAHRPGGDLLARVYRPDLAGPLPAAVEIHGGVWTRGDRMSDVVFCSRLAERGVLVAAVDFRLAPDHPYPAQIADQNEAIAWLARSAARWGGDPTSIGAIGLSSGGHTMLVNALRPHDPRYRAAAEPTALAYAVGLFAVVDPYARYEYARSRDGEHARGLVDRTLSFFRTEEAMREGSPQLILERGEQECTPPLLLIHPRADRNVPGPLVERFAAAYRAAGGDVELHWFDDVAHGFVRDAGPATERAIDLVVRFIDARRRRGNGAAAADP